MMRLWRMPPGAGVAGLILAVSLLAGCGPAINKNAQNSFLTSDDLVQMTDKMAADLAKDWKVANLLRSTGKPMSIVMMPVRNETNEIIPDNQKWMYVHRVRVLLSSKQELRSQFTFVLNKRDYEKLLKEEGVSTEALGPDESRIVPEYALTGTFYADTNASARNRSDFYLCTYRLTRINPGAAGTGEIIWENSYETKKSITKGLLD